MRPAYVLGGTLLAVAVLGVLAGLWSSVDVQSKEPEASVNVTRPDYSHLEARTAIVGNMAPRAGKAQGAPTFAKPRSIQRRVPEANPVAAMEQRAEEVPEISTERVTARTSGAGDTLAKMPLSMSAIAGTLGRIGYSCGEVASTTAVEAAAGVFKVTCTSGSSFRAAPVHGRYRFRRWAGEE